MKSSSSNKKKSSRCHNIQVSHFLEGFQKHSKEFSLKSMITCMCIESKFKNNIKGRSLIVSNNIKIHIRGYEKKLTRKVTMKKRQHLNR